ncbi:MAG: hypothetical protein NC408_02010 [Candidatus Gastranaerophilales bacterium]|nr:hypothetical protein [Candidatus Gastranaerophilales bacterium]MCM1073793.1 hypothetical protein [Bacteroides sp.]
MNILIIGKIQNNLLEAVCNSKLLDKLYTATLEPLEEIPNIEFENFEDLARKAKALKIDFALTSDKDLIQAGIADVLKKYLVNIFAVNKKWSNLETSRLAAKQLANYYSINTPEVIKAPLAFPVVIKTNRPKGTYIANSISDLVNKMEQLEGEKTFLEEYLRGEVYELTSLWDGKNILSFPLENLTEVQQDRLELYKTKLNFMLSDEKADFMGFFVSKLIWAKNDWYLLEYKMGVNKSSKFYGDLLYILNSALYQKLNEIQV